MENVFNSFRLKSVAISAAVVSVLLVVFYGYFLIIHEQTYYCDFDYNVTHDNLYSEKPEDIEALCKQLNNSRNIQL